MPELPEVETIASQLREVLGPELQDWSFAVKLSPTFYPEIYTGIASISRAGKNILLSGKSYVVRIHLGMSGNLRISRNDPELSSREIIALYKHTRSILSFRNHDKSKDFLLVMTDTRGFGQFELSNSGIFPSIKKLGVDPLSSQYNWLWFSQAAREKKNTRIADFLLRQDVICGIGNIYRSEILHYCQIRPDRSVGSISRDYLLYMYKVIPNILISSLELGGCSMNDHRSTYVDLYGARGKFASKLQVYQREGLNCFNCGGTIASMNIEKKRRVFYCPGCQQ